MAEIELKEDLEFEKIDGNDFFYRGGSFSYGEIAEDVGWALCNLTPGDYHLIIMSDDQYNQMFL